ncbi:transcription factor bHLH51-like [Impatiens glandulifera]|uniref:transcription factor bHLH51-like n=1 Tax=Impatiens glandulifera TaxID=253017 RepID=UPI001FB19CEC|nr:transcription factor bHLH51-like [Impatiens glandulifera]
MEQLDYCGFAQLDDQELAPTDQERETSISLPWHIPPGDSLPFHGYHDSSSLPFGEDRSISASRSHSQAEKRRRDRINTQMAALRKLVPKSDKMDKAALLGSVIEQVKDLKRKATEASKSLIVPVDIDEVTVELFLDEEEDEEAAAAAAACSSEINNNPESILIRASVCCEDRPELFEELSQALKSLNLGTVRAEISSLGGRVKSILVLCTSKGVCLNSLKQSLKGVLVKIASSSETSGASSYTIKSRRQRFFFPSSQCSTTFFS